MLALLCCMEQCELGLCDKKLNQVEEEIKKIREN